MKVIYIHGYEGNPDNDKVKVLKESFDVYAPQLPVNCKMAIEFLENVIKSYETKKEEYILIGSSLGGYYSDYLGTKYNVPVVLINPLPSAKMMYDVDKDFEYVNYLDSLKADRTVSNSTLVLLDKGDELFDYKISVDKYNNYARVVVYDGGSHRFNHITKAIGEIHKHANAIV